MSGRRAWALVATTLAAVAPVAVLAQPQAGPPPPPDGTLAPPPSLPAFSDGPPSAPVEPAHDASAYTLRSGPQCADFERAPGGGWRALASVRFPGPQGEARIPAGQVAAPGAYVAGLDLAAILQARCL